ncbi:MAG: ABC transporter substrate-binding protein [Spirochaetaceae bacterium]|jgi:ABC-type nitrate/sulfonate/bicarbonate transport system substrate-binding protein|nr:ABC transporter substrate-binding protein [Spirochaetaceae bacterium]
MAFLIGKNGKIPLLFLTAALFFVPGVLFAAGGGEKKTELPAGVVEFKYPEWVYYDLIYLADDLGYFENAGVRPRYVGQIAAGQMIPALTTGDLDVANRHTPLVVAAVASGADIKIFAAGSKSTQANPHMKYFVRADSSIRSIKDFGGKTLGINSFGACSEYVTKKYCLDNGVDPASIKMSTAPDSEQEVPLLRGDTDVAIIHPLSSGRASANTTDFRLLFSDWDIDGGISGMCPYSVSGKFLKEHPEAVRELTEILSRAARWNNDHPEEARQLMAKRFGFKIEETEMFEFYPDQIVPALNIQYWLDRLEAEKKLGPGQVRPEQVYTNQYNAANRT